MTFPRSLTTTPFERSSTGRFEACPCRPASGGQLPSSVQHHELTLVFVTHTRPRLLLVSRAVRAAPGSPGATGRAPRARPPSSVAALALVEPCLTVSTAF